MLRSASRLLGYRLSATDGEVGRCQDFLLDEQAFRLCHVVVKAASRLGGGQLLVSPLAFRKGEWNFRHWVVESTCEQVQAAQLLEQAPPRAPSSSSSAVQAPGATASEVATPSAAPLAAEALAGAPLAAETPVFAIQATATPMLAEPPPLPAPIAPPALRSLTELLGYGLDAEDGRVGHISDLILNDDSWTCPYFVVTDLTAFPVRQVLVPSSWVREVLAPERRVVLSGARARVQAEPAFDPDAPHYGGAGALSAGLAGAADLVVPANDMLPLASAAPASRPWRLVPATALAHALTWSRRGLRAAFTRTLQSRAR